MKRTIYSLLTILIVGLLLTGGVSPVLASSQPAVLPAAGQQASSPGGPQDAHELEAFLDGILADQLVPMNIPGATLSVVKDGKILLAKGYGYANLEKHIPVDPQKTLFRPGSVSKLLLWTAVMQLVEQHKLDLHADVNTYLKNFKIPASYPAPITLADLMWHSPGFEDQGLGIFVKSTTDLQPLGSYLATHIPARVYPPGEISAYSNFGASLAGYIVEQVSGMPYEQYVQKNILAPLNMTHSTFAQPLPANLAPDMAVGYTYKNGAYKAQDFELVQSIPAGASSATATDMANFMIAHLQNGAFGDQRILAEGTAKEMHTQDFTQEPRFGGWAHGFMVLNFNNQSIIWHAGDTIYFHSMLVLLPASNTGLFISYNSINGADARLQLLRAFMDHYYPVAPFQAPKPSPGFLKQAGQFSGSYAPSRANFTSFEKLTLLFATINIRPLPEGTLLLSAAGGQPKQYVQIDASDPTLFGEINSGDKIAFRSDSSGQITYLFIDGNPTAAYIKQKWYENSSLHQVVLAVSLLVFLVTLIAWPIGWFSNRKKGLPYSRFSRTGRILGWLMSLLTIIFAVLLLVTISNQDFIFGLTPVLKTILAIPWVTGVLAVTLVVFAVLFYNRKDDRRGRVWFTVLAFTGVIFTLWEIFWKLLVL